MRVWMMGAGVRAYHMTLLREDTLWGKTSWVNPVRSVF